MMAKRIMVMVVMAALIAVGTAVSALPAYALPNDGGAGGVDTNKSEAMCYIDCIFWSGSSDYSPDGTYTGPGPDDAQFCDATCNALEGVDPGGGTTNPNRPKP